MCSICGIMHQTMLGRCVCVRVCVCECVSVCARIALGVAVNSVSAPLWESVLSVSFCRQVIHRIKIF